MNLRVVFIAWLKSPISITLRVRRAINRFPLVPAFQFLLERLLALFQRRNDLSPLQGRSLNLKTLRIGRVVKHRSLQVEMRLVDVCIVVTQDCPDSALDSTIEALRSTNVQMRSVSFINPDGTLADPAKIFSNARLKRKLTDYSWLLADESNPVALLVVRAGVQPCRDAFDLLSYACVTADEANQHPLIAYGDHIDITKRRVVSLPKANLALLKSNSYLRNLFLVANHQLNQEEIALFVTQLMGFQDWPSMLGLVTRHEQLLHVNRVLSLAPAESRVPPKRINNGTRLDMEPSVEIVIPTRDQPKILATCLDTLFNKTRYSNFKVTLVDNGSVELETHLLISTYSKLGMRVVEHNAGFNFSRLNNLVALESESDFVCLLNNDVEIIDVDWLSKLVQTSIRHQGALVGPMLLYPDGLVQHAGVRASLWGSAGHSYSRFDPAAITDHSLLQSISEVDALTAACLLVPTHTYKRLGGLDESFEVGLNDIDFCLRARLEGERCIYVPHSRLIHHESVSRGGRITTNKAVGLISEVLRFRLRYPDLRQLSYFGTLSAASSDTVASKNVYFDWLGRLK